MADRPRYVAPNDQPDEAPLLGAMFVGEGQAIVRVLAAEYDQRSAKHYGPFLSADIASMWAGDNFPNLPTKVIPLMEPRDNRHGRHDQPENDD